MQLDASWLILGPPGPEARLATLATSTNATNYDKKMQHVFACILDPPLLAIPDQDSSGRVMVMICTLGPNSDTNHTVAQPNQMATYYNLKSLGGRCRLDRSSV